MRNLFFAASVLALAAAGPALAAGKPELGSFGFDETGMDKSVKAGDDFVGYTSGTYLKTLEIPADRSNYGMFTKLRDLSQERTRQIIEDAAKMPSAPGSNGQKVGDFYASFMDEAAIEAKGVAPIKPRLDAIAALADKAALARMMGEGNREGISSPINIGVEQDLKNPGTMAAYVGQGGLGLPDRDYYFDTANPRFAAARDQYKKSITDLLTLAGYDRAAERAAGVYALEEKIAKAHWTRVESRQIDKLYNPVARGAVDATYPGFAWTPFLAAAGLDGQSQIIIANPSAVQGAAALIASEPLAVWQDYLAVRTLLDASSFLPKAFVDAQFALSKVLSGQPEIQPRWKRAVDFTSSTLGEAAGELYVAKYFPPEAKAKADKMVKDIIAAMDVRLSNLAWMDPKTRAAARDKLASFTPKIGYPDKWRDYSQLQIVRGDALGNGRRAAQFEYARSLAKIGKPIDKSEWGMTPMTVNAYANPLWNEIVFPAAILQAPFFDPNADDAVNYGAIGAVIGHEITHHFDDQGRKFDKDGKLSDWWTKEDETRFKALTDKVVAQYGAYEPLPGKKINGELTLGENIADLAGLNIALDAYKRSLNGKTAPVINGWSGEQRFFLGFSQVWRQKYRDAILNQLLTVDPHSPGNFRPYVVRNLDAWYKNFNVQPGEAYYLAPEQRLKLW
jgi:putative endopeptidase